MTLREAYNLLVSGKATRIDSDKASWYIETEHLTQEQLTIATYLRLAEADDWKAYSKTYMFVELDEAGDEIRPV